MKYRGTFEDLQNIVCKCGYKIKEIKSLSLNSSGGYQIKTCDGGIINWYESTGTLSFQGKENTKQKLREDLVQYIETKSTTPFPKIASNTSNKKIFIVHGHDHVALEQLELILRRLELEPYILQNTGGNGFPIIETLKKEICKGSIGFGIVLLTPDDIGYAISDGETKAHPRARQNVILEMGMLISILPFDKIAILYKEGVEIPSDVNGIYYLSFEKHVQETFPKLINRLKGAEVPFSQDAIPCALNSM
ncbi:MULTISPECIES: TIR domain-containing protein [Bartonella]|uniref:TIR domain-containing protein n=1 Tax=Bartonella TaxID=773 RepID=UPI00235FE3C1|nr:MULTISPECIES: TIR domain-containing protein [Bartonella]